MKPEVKRQAYRSRTGLEIYVQQAFGMWVVMHRGCGKIPGTVRHPDVFLPEGSFEEVQKALDNLAEKLGWVSVRTCRVCGCTERSGCRDGCQWVEKDLCGRCTGNG